MTASEVQSTPLEQVYGRWFLRAYTASEQLQSDFPSSQLQLCSQHLQACQEQVEQAGLFSANETLEDLSTPSIKYMLLPYLAAEVALASANRQQGEAKTAQLQHALQLLQRFMHRCLDYEVPGAATAERFAGQHATSTPMDPQTKRMLKISAFNRNKEIQQQLQQYAAAAAIPVNEQGTWQPQQAKEGRARGHVSDVDEGSDKEEAAREFWLATVERALLQSVEKIAFLQQELELLRHMSSLPQDRRHVPQQPDPQLLAQLRSAVNGLQGQRAAVAEGVFRPSHNLPTMSLEAFGRLELQRAQEREAAEAQAAAQRVAKADASSDDDDAGALAKARAMDDFKDNVRRGSGNSKLRPCS